jgi:hypothetical protein
MSKSKIENVKCLIMVPVAKTAFSVHTAPTPLPIGATLASSSILKPLNNAMRLISEFIMAM